MRKILVLRGGALGDLIVTLPALGLLRQRWPAARIELSGNATAAALAQSRGLIDAVHSQHEARWSSLYGDARLPVAFTDWLADFDLVINFWPDPDGELGRRLPLRAGQTFLSAPAMPTRAPAAAHYCEPLQVLGLEPRSFFHRLDPIALPAGSVAQASPPAPPRLVDRPSALPGACRAATHISIHPGSGSPRKNWPAENWRELLAQLPLPLTLILGEAEVERWGSFSASGIHSLVTPPLEELVALFSRSSLFLGHDSGISHLAAACGARCVLLFGPTDPAMWAPPAPHVQVLQPRPDLAALSVADLCRAANAALGDYT